jgi:nucleotide-binding universal stress UspA family protein
MLGEGTRIVVRAARGRADLALIELASESQADLMVAGTHQQQGLGRLVAPSVSRGLLYHASASVAVVPAAQALRRLPPVPVLRRVLVATDLSPLGNRAISHACAIAAPGGVVRLVHVVHPRAVPGGQYESGLLGSGRHQQHLRACSRRLQALVPAEAGARGLTVEAQVVEATDPATGLTQEAERFAADVIVLGSQGRSALGRVLLGSVAQSVMTATTRPVFVVRFPKE